MERERSQGNVGQSGGKRGTVFLARERKKRHRTYCRIKEKKKGGTIVFLTYAKDKKRNAQGVRRRGRRGEKKRGGIPSKGPGPVPASTKRKEKRKNPSDVGRKEKKLRPSGGKKNPGVRRLLEGKGVAGEIDPGGERGKIGTSLPKENCPQLGPDAKKKKSEGKKGTG